MSACWRASNTYFTLLSTTSSLWMQRPVNFKISIASLETRPLRIKFMSPFHKPNPIEYQHLTPWNMASTIGACRGKVKNGVENNKLCQTLYCYGKWRKDIPLCDFKIYILVRAIAQWLGLWTSAEAPMVSLSFLQCNFEWFLVVHDSVGLLGRSGVDIG